jgi:uncharacterized membrane protein
MKQTLLSEETVALITKVIFPAAIAVGIKSFIEMKKDKSKISLLNVISSMFIGVGGAYLASAYMLEEVDPKYLSIVVAIIAILTDKIAEFFMYKFKVDVFILASIDTIFGRTNKR